MLPAIKRAITGKLELLAELGGLALSFSGATLAAVVGKLLVAAVLGALSLGFFLRLVGRRGVRAASPPPPGWLRPTAAALSVVEAAVLVEATNLPVRFDQPGFATYHWLLVLLVLVAAYMLQSQVLRSLVVRGNEKRAA
jgi:hypothetical protein